MKDNIELKQEDQVKPYDMIILIGEDLKGQAGQIKYYLKQKEEESGGKFKAIIFGDGYGTTIKDLLARDEVIEAIKNSNDKTLLELYAHGHNFKEYEEKSDSYKKRGIHQISDFETTAILLQEIKGITPNIKNVKLLSCHSGTNARANIKDSEYGRSYRTATERMLVLETSDSKYRISQEDGLRRTKDSIDSIFNGVMNDESEIEKREIIISALRSPLSMFITNNGESYKLSRLFNNYPKDEKGEYIVNEGSLDKIMTDFIDKRTEELKAIFPTAQDAILIDELVKSEIDNNLLQTLKDKALFNYIYRSLHDDGDNSVTLALIKTGSNLDLRNDDGSTPLIFACMSISNTSLRTAGNLEIVNALLAQKDIDINAQDNAGRTALTQACLNNNTDIIKAIIADERITKQTLISALISYNHTKHPDSDVIKAMISKINENLDDKVIDQKDEKSDKDFIKDQTLNKKSQDVFSSPVIEDLEIGSDIKVSPKINIPDQNIISESFSELLKSPSPYCNNPQATLLNINKNNEFYKD